MSFASDPMSDACGRYPEPLNGEYDVQPCCANCLHFWEFLSIKAPARIVDGKLWQPCYHINYGVCELKAEEKLGKEALVDDVFGYVMDEIYSDDSCPCECWEEE